VCSSDLGRLEGADERRQGWPSGGLGRDRGLAVQRTVSRSRY
jgi:hypothetical protein